MQDFIEDEKKDVTRELHPDLVPSCNHEIMVADSQFRAKELLFPENKEITVNMMKNLLNLIAARINRAPGSYDNTLKDIEALAHKHGIPVSTLNIPEKITMYPEPYQGAMLDYNGSATTLVINCEQVGVSNVAQAGMLAHGILPSMENLIVKPESLVFAQKDNGQNREENVGQLTPQILIDGVFFQMYQTGIARVWRSLLEEWASHTFAQHLVVLDRAGTAPKIPGIRYLTIPSYDYGNTDADREMLQQICDEAGADLFISTYYTTPLSTTSVFMAYDMIPEVWRADLREPMWREKHYGIRHASAYIAISENTARDLVKFFPEISPDSVTVAYCGVTDVFSPANPEEINRFKTKYGISKPYFMAVGIGDGYKNTGLFFKAIAQLCSRQGFEIICTGSGGLLSPEFRAYTSGIVVHMLQLNDEELKAAYSGAIALVYPSKYEGFGLPVLEAMSCGCPVVTCANASIPEVAGEAALYVNDEDVNELTNALCEVQKPDVRHSLIAAGLERAKKFSWSSMAEKVSLALIEATLFPLKLKDINFIVFPDWEQPEESLGLELARVLAAVVTHTDKSQMTLLLDISNISEEDANLFLSSVTMNLFMEEELDVTDGPEISLVGQLGERQWEALLPRLQARIVLENENQQAIARTKAQLLSSATFDSLSNKRFI